VSEGAFRRGYGRRQAATLCLLVGALAACGQASTPAAQPVAEGQAFPAALLALLSDPGDTGRALQGKMLVLNLWATWCPPCRQEMPDLERLGKALDPARFVVVGLSVDADTFLAAEFLLQNGITFANHFDQNGAVSRSLGLQSYPQTFVIAPNRTLVKQIQGYQAWNAPSMHDMLEGLYQASLRAGGQGLRTVK
jgi:thiol-disulfide isomerase/thioredoxin